MTRERGIGGGCRTPWLEPIPDPAALELELRTLRWPGREHPRAVLALRSPFLTGYRLVHLTRPVAYHGQAGPPAWLDRARTAVMMECAGAGPVTMSDLAGVAERAHRGQGVKRK